MHFVKPQQKPTLFPTLPSASSAAKGKTRWNTYNFGVLLSLPSLAKFEAMAVDQAPSSTVSQPLSSERGLPLDSTLSTFEGAVIRLS